MTKFKTEHKDDKTSVGFLFWKVSNLHQKLQREVLKDLDLTPTQFSLLACYYYLADYSDEPLNQAKVCEQSGLDKMVVSDMTKVLVAKKFLTKKSSKLDKRSFEIELTPLGKTICNKAVVRIEKLDDEFFSKSGSKEKFLSMLKKMLSE